MTSWMLALVALLPAFAIPAVAACHGGTAGRLVAVQLATSVATLMLILMTFAFDQSAFIDLALTLALLTLPGTLIITLFLERWL
ncbi:monovalent cation/H+ antiporter complex subunit F [Rhodopila sp.]|uniref:monovalent cation/H+ antiporter complex subunit F n=1 Tax=Rhodopila sp. TaxID=2480087 RepID=UPI003D107325